jgi:tellurite resistance-related uncharacterized protein
MQHGDRPDGLALQRTTDDLDAESVPRGLLRAHHLAEGVWGRLQVKDGSLRFVWEDEGAGAVDLSAGDSVVIPPKVLHHAEPASDVRFVIEFYR